MQFWSLSHETIANNSTWLSTKLRVPRKFSQALDEQVSLESAYLRPRHHSSRNHIPHWPWEHLKDQHGRSDRVRRSIVTCRRL